MVMGVRNQVHCLKVPLERHVVPMRTGSMSVHGLLAYPWARAPTRYLCTVIHGASVPQSSNSLIPTKLAAGDVLPLRQCIARGSASVCEVWSCCQECYLGTGEGQDPEGPPWLAPDRPH